MSANKFSRECFASSLEEIYLETIQTYKNNRENINRAESIKQIASKIKEVLALELPLKGSSIIGDEEDETED